MAMVRNSVGAGWYDPLFLTNVYNPNLQFSELPPPICVCALSQTVMWLMNWWFPGRVAEWGWETQMLRDGWWWSTCCVRWRRRSGYECFLTHVSLTLVSACLPPLTLTMLSVRAGGVWGFSWTLYNCYSDWSCYQSNGTWLLCKYWWNANNKSRDIKPSKMTDAEVNTKDFKGPFAPFNNAPWDNEHYSPLGHLTIEEFYSSTVFWVQFWISLLDHHG